jgi:ribosomal-protein-alanine N-acetyltransferase
MSGARQRRDAVRPVFAPIVLPAARVTLRCLAAADAPAIFRIFSDPRVMRHWSRPPMKDDAEALALLREVRAGYRSGEILQLGIERHGDRLLIGTCTLFHFLRASRRCELGYALGSAHWGQGLMREALQRLLDFAFDELELNRIEADIDPRNAASARLLERLGFIREGHLRQRWIVAGSISDTDLYGLLRSEWKSGLPLAGEHPAV